MKYELKLIRRRRGCGWWRALVVLVQQRWSRRQLRLACDNVRRRVSLMSREERDALYRRGKEIVDGK